MSGDEKLALLNLVSDIIYKLDINFICLSVYGKGLAKFNKDPEYCIGKKVTDIFGNKNEAKHLEACGQALSGESVSYKWDELIENNRTYFHTSLTPIIDESGKVTGIVGIVRDISGIMLNQLNNKEKEELYQKSLEHSHKLLDYIINHNKSGVAVHDKEMNYIYVSQKYIEQYRLKETDIIGKNHYDVFPDLPQRWKDVHKRVLNGEVISKDRDPFLRGDGSTDWTRWECRPWYEIDGSIGGLIVYTEVINSQLEIENKLIEKVNEINIQKNRIETTLNSIGDAVISIDNNGYIIYVNDAGVKLLGSERYNLIGKLYFDVVNIYDEYTNERITDSVETVFKTHSRFELNKRAYLISMDQKKYYIENNASPIINTRGEFIGAISVIRDITERRQKQLEVEFYSTHDSLTGLYNRRYMTEELTHMDNGDYYPIGLLIMDINGLKIINDAYGFDKGDEIIKTVGEMLNHICDNRWIKGRVGGDEFAVLIGNTTYAELEELKDNIKRNMSNKTLHNNKITLSIGASLRVDNMQNITSFISEAENNMYKNKLIDGRSVRNNAIKAILKTLTEKYSYEYIHSKRVSEFCRKMGQVLNLSEDEINELETAGMYHDIGKISIPDAILDKPGRLTEEEFTIMKTHCEVGYQILKAADAYSNLAEYALSHHERWDGLGYPHGLKGEDIPLSARIICIADAFEAMTTDRVYRKKITVKEAAQEIKRCSGKQFDPILSEIFVTKVINEEW